METARPPTGGFPISACHSDILGGVKNFGIVVAVLMGAGCYAPSFQDCELACGGTGADACPAGLTCASGACRLPGMTAACTVTPIVDAPMIDAPGTCWPYATSTIDPCVAGFPPSSGTLSVTTTRTIDTTSPGADDGVLYLGGRYLVLHVSTVDIASTAALTVTGARPLIIVADGDVDVTGTIAVQPTMVTPMDCALGSPGNANVSGSGGSGGGYGTTGGTGGTTVSSGTTAGGVVSGDATLVPLRPGCPGGRGGGTAGLAGIGGRAGGALQITTKTRLVVAGGGTIAAGGGGGGGGANGTCAGVACSGAGGGGGTGGSILLEANRVDIRVNGRVCAVGGAGGNGPLTTNPQAPGTSGSDGVLCTGGNTGIIGNSGGRGAGVAGALGGAGSNGSSNLDSGAGGGGGLGRTRIRGALQRDVVGTVIPVPAP